jgi:hypothetical protein
VTEPHGPPPRDHIEVLPVVVLSQTFPARPSSIPEIRDFVSRGLAESPLTEQENQQVRETVFRALLDAAGPTGTIQVSFRIYPDEVEVDVLRSDPGLGTHPSPRTLMASMPLAARPAEQPRPVEQPVAATSEPVTLVAHDTFAEWMSTVLRREGLTQEAAARQLGVSV